MGQNYGPDPRKASSFIGSTTGCTLSIDALDYTSGSSTINDAVGTNNATVSASVSYGDDGGNKYFNNNGSQKAINISSITPGNSTWTLAIWAQGKSSLPSSTHGQIMSNSSGGPVASSYGMCSNGIAQSNYDGSWNTHYGDTNLVVDTWYHLLWANGTGGSNTMIMYLNGAADISEFNSATTNGGPINVIGSRWNTGFTGYIASVQYFASTCLTAAQISNMYNEQKGRFGL